MFESIAAGDDWLEDREGVQVVEADGEARAYPLAILIWHEIVNDTIGGVPVAVTYCPLCNSAITFDRRLGGRTLDFGVSGVLRHSDLVMYDRQTESWWQQVTGEAIVGELTGERLALMPSFLVSWGDFKDAYPDAQVLSRDTGHRRQYGRNPYELYDRQNPFLFRGEPDKRLRALDRVVVVEEGDEAVAFPLTTLEQEPVVHYTLGGRDLVVLFQLGTASALDDASDGRGPRRGRRCRLPPRVQRPTAHLHRRGRALRRRPDRQPLEPPRPRRRRPPRRRATGSPSSTAPTSGSHGPSSNPTPPSTAASS